MSFDIQPKKHSLSSNNNKQDTPPPNFSERQYSYPAYQVVRPSHAQFEHRKNRSWLVWFWLLLCLIGGGIFIFPRGIEWKDQLLLTGETGARSLERALNELKTGDFETAGKTFESARESFEAVERELAGWGIVIDSVRFIPGLSKLSSGKNLLKAGTHMARAGERLHVVAAIFLSNLSGKTGEGVAMLDLLLAADPELLKMRNELVSAREAVERVRLADVPMDRQPAFLELKEKLPSVIALLDAYLERAPLFEELLGVNGPRTYLFLFQNSHELRATGGFIGSYARLDLMRGKIRQFYIDGIFNPDGQLKENIVPPKPIQKISAGWSLHDSNWFPDFPMSAEKAIFFYEKTGGPTVDGVITITPTLLEKLLSITGPIELPEYAVTISAENFMPIVQEEVEVKYNREENKPKKILSDLSSAIFERLLLVPDPERFRKVADAIVTGLNERHILLYSRHPETQALISAAGWSGNILPAPHDYLAVVHTNINGYKTDGVIDDSITHQIEVQTDGSIIDTVSITRRHRGGDTPYPWWNKVNANYMRVYVPLGSELLLAEGMTREFPPAPLDYDTLGFRRDPDIEREEKAITIDEASGTRIGVDAGKTVFGNWVYVSPGESVTVTYRYRLPITLPLHQLRSGLPQSYSVIYQKQSGTSGVRYQGKIILPANFEPVWQTGQNLIRYGRTWEFDGTLDRNQFYGWVFAQEKPQ